MKLSLSRGFPLKQTLTGDELPDECANNCIERKQCLLGKKDEVEKGDEGRVPCPGECFASAALSTAGEGTAQTECASDESGKDQQEKWNDGPVKRAAGKPEPACNEEDEGERFDEGTSQVVEDLPSCNGLDGAGRPLA